MPRSLLHACLAAAALSAALFAPAAMAGRLADVQVYDRNTGQPLELYRHRGRLYVAGEPGHEYEIHVRNRTGGRILAVGSVDGVNVVSGETAAASQSGYVIDGYDTLQVDGWRKSLGEVAAFYFTSLPDSYAARTGRPGNVGVIGIALYRERQAPYWRGPAPLAGKAESGKADGAPAGPMPAPQASADAARSRQPAYEAQSAEKLGTGHGDRHDSQATYVDFERAADSPDEVVALYYDSRRNLVAQGVIRMQPRWAERRPNPFPGGFVPDP